MEVRLVYFATFILFLLIYNRYLNVDIDIQINREKVRESNRGHGDHYVVLNIETGASRNCQNDTLATAYVSCKRQ